MARFFASRPTQATVVKYQATGNPADVLKIETEALPATGKVQVLVKMLAAPINPADINMIQGIYGKSASLPAVGGNEGVGEIVEVGAGVSGFAVNDRVIPIKAGLGTWRTHGVFNASDLHAIPKDIKKEYAATVSVNPSAAYRLLEDFVKLQAGDVIVQNGANSTVGISVIQLAAQKNIKTINIIRDRSDFPETVERLKKLGGYIVVSEDYAKTPQFKRLLSDMPKPKLGLNGVGGSSATEVARTLGENATMVTYGGMSSRPVTIPTSLFIFRNIQAKGFWLTKWAETHPAAERAAMLNSLFDMIRQDKLKLWLETHKFEKFQEALKRSQEPKRDRKVVLTFE